MTNHILIIVIVSFIISCTSSDKISNSTTIEEPKTDKYDTTEFINSENLLVKTKLRNDKVFSKNFIDPETNETTKYLLFHNDGKTVANEYHKKMVRTNM